MPKYLEIMNNILADIKSGRYTPGHTLPTEEELSSIYSVSRTSIRNALKELQKKGIIHKKRGSGNYIKEQSKEPVSQQKMNLAVIVNLQEGKPESSIFESPTNQSIMRGMKSVIDQEEAVLSLSMYNGDSTQPGNEISANKQIDGFLDLGNTISDTLNDYFVSSQSKVVSILSQHNMHLFNNANPYVLLDEKTGIRNALSHYKSLSYSKFGYIGLAESGLRNYRMFQEAFKAEDAVFDTSCVIIHPESTANMVNLWERVQQIANTIINNKMETDVFFFDGQEVAIYLMKLLLDKKPELAKKVKFCFLGELTGNEMVSAKYFDCIEPQIEQAGAAAAELLIEAIKCGKFKNKVHSLPSVFISNN